LELNELKRAMIVAAHPDDPDIGCGGTAARMTKNGSEVIYVVCTRGDKGSSDLEMTSDRLPVLRDAEQRAAAEVLGVKEVVFLNELDGEVQNTLAFRGDVVRAIRYYRPDAVFTHDPTGHILRNTFLNHPDHRAVGTVALDAIFPSARDHLQYPDHYYKEGLLPHKVLEVYLFGSNEPNIWIDVADTIELKIAALLKHVTQFGEREQMGDFVRARAQAIGEGQDLAYAEAFRRISLPR